MVQIMSIRTNPGDDLALRILHAENYPFARPACSYLFTDGTMQPFDPEACEGRLPIVASGSNASPERLRAKFGENERIPVTRAELRDFAVVFAGHFTAYGAIPATLVHCAGAVTAVWITWLTPEDLAIMHRSEGVVGCREVEQRYDFVSLTGIDLRPEGMSAIEEAGAYLSRRMMAPDGQPVRFAEVTARGQGLQACSERAMLRHAAGLLEPARPFTDFMAGVLSGPDERQALFDRLAPYTIERTSEPAAGDGGSD